ncbi:endo-beta-1,4-glucanase [Frankliniella occidentalis]|nr:endo-beta-1,4-glucanase [Frankliniella occidentalis]
MSLCQSTGTATTTRYWDCCKTTCAWSANAGSVTGPVETCAAGGATVVDANTQSGCAGGSAYVCNTQQPFVQDGQAYAFAAANVNGTATTTRYWDCCKTTCAWSANAGSVTGPVETCAAGGATVVDANTQSGCAGGSAYVCNTQQPFVQDGQAYAFAAANVNGLATSSLCCACYTLTFNAAPVQGQKLTVQVINTGSDLNSNQFDLQIPGGGFGMFTEGCPKEWPAYTSSAWGAQYGGVANRYVPKELIASLFGQGEAGFDFWHTQL